jgi:CNT family concentrative nucleoside transporter
MGQERCMSSRWASLFGIFLIIGVAVAGSRNRRAIRWKSVGMGLLLQITLGVTILGIPSLGVPGIFRVVFDFLNLVLTSLVDFTAAGSQFIFGNLADPTGSWGFIFAFRALPSIIFFSALMAVLYHIGLLQKVVHALAWVMQRTMKTSGAETLSGAANIFVGQTEAPMMVRPYLEGMTESEIFCVMVGGMATIAGGVEGVYIGLLKGRVPDIGGHLLTASVMAACGALVISKILFPEMEKPVTGGKIKFDDSRPDNNSIEAISRGATEGVHLAINVAAMLIAFISMIALVDALLGKIGLWMHVTHPVNLALILGFLFRPLPWILGIPWNEAALVGKLLGEKIIINEFVGYVHLSEIAAQLSDRTVIIASYALCGFANVSSIGIQLGGLGGMAPNQRARIARLGLRAVIAGNLACFLSACVAGLLF